jgi:sec-independent protein translocase protein TatC
MTIHQYIPHLLELRQRLIYTSIFFLIVFACCFWVDETLYLYLAKPLIRHLPSGGQLIATEVTSTFTVPMKLAMVTTLFISIPFILYQLWAFISPGLYPHEKKRIYLYLFLSIFLFYLGIAFAFGILCPLALQFFANIAPPGILVMTDIRHYLDFVLTLIFAGGLTFQVPVITLALIDSGLVQITILTHIRPYVIVGAFVVGALLAPPDVISQTLLALPMWGLYELGILIAKYRSRSDKFCAPTTK